MKYIKGLIIAALAVATLQGCKKERTAEEIAVAEKAKADSIEQVEAEQRAARRAELVKLNEQKAGRRTKSLERRLSKGRSYKDARGNVVYIKADEMPMFRSSEAELQEYLKENVKYPQNALDNGDEGVVYVDFVVDKTGRVTDVVGTDSVNTDMNPMFVEEAVRVVGTMPDWTPAKEKGKPVAVAYSIPIKFELE